MVDGEDDDARPEDKTVAPGIFLGDAACLARAAEPPPGVQYQFRIFAGYSGWGPGQLEAELERGYWQLAAAEPELVFDWDRDKVWDEARARQLREP